MSKRTRKTPSGDLRRVRVDPESPAPDSIKGAVEWLRRGGIVAMPTDTLYGLAVDPWSASAVRALLALKGRPESLALPLVAGSFDQVVARIGRLGPVGLALARRFWPGPLALIVDAPEAIVPSVHAGTNGVAVRVPAHAVARQVALEFGWPVTATSANRSGQPAAASPEDLVEIAGDPRVYLIDAGAVPGGAASTIVDVRFTPPRLLREGAVPWSRVLESWYT